MSRANKQVRRKHRQHKREQRFRRGLQPRVAPFFDARLKDEVELLGYAITEDRLDGDFGAGTPILDVLSAADHTRLFELLHADPSAAVDELIPLVEKFPDCGMLTGWIASGLLVLDGRRDEAEQWARRTYQHWPKYLFARICLAKVMLARGDLDGVEELFGGKWDLKLLYPERKIFHISEFRSMSSLTVEYLIRRGKLEVAAQIVKAAEEVAPGHPMTRQMRGWCDHAMLLQSMKKLLKRAPLMGLMWR